MGVAEGVFLPTDDIGERDMQLLMDESRHVYSMERIPPFLTGFATRALRAHLRDLVAREVAKDIVFVDWLMGLMYFIQLY
mmetsp:Transcript_619/g.1292  ORF Transcript_619/g.1292 Transcript_619/m.1292 type:complete len:80 (+) Transcript_619:220-459(+)